MVVLAMCLASACAKQPATMAAGSSPAPTGVSSTSATVRQAANAGSGAARSSVSSSSSERPKIADFVATAALPDIHFDFDKYELRADAMRALDAGASWLKSNSRQLLLIEGHCDERGTNEYNVALGERRAKATMNYLVSRGIEAGRITIVSYGEDRPQCHEHNEACWAKNRRAHFLVKGQ
jgi:peptidoglycan-associated lipoprotein